MQLSTPRREAQSATAARGHKMRWGQPLYGPNSAQNAVCSICGRGVTIQTHPAPNSINIGGEAVAVDCRHD